MLKLWILCYLERLLRLGDRDLRPRLGDERLRLLGDGDRRLRRERERLRRRDERLAAGDFERLLLRPPRRRDRPVLCERLFRVDVFRESSPAFLVADRELERLRRRFCRSEEEDALRERLFDLLRLRSRLLFSGDRVLFSEVSLIGEEDLRFSVESGEEFLFKGVVLLENMEI